MSAVHRPLEWMAADPLIAPHVPFVATIDGVLSPAECVALIARIEALGPEMATINRGATPDLDRRIRDNDRVLFDDVPLAADLFIRLGDAVPTPWKSTGERAAGLNERFRGYRYSPGQCFKPHYDGAVGRGGEVSEITVLFYLNDCAGGDTAFLDFDLRIAPRAGMALLFQHVMLHEGCPVTAGHKYVLRSDVMYTPPR